MSDFHDAVARLRASKEGDSLPAPPPVLHLVHDENTTAYGRRALEAEVERVETATEGGRNDALNRAAFSLGQLVAGGVLKETDVVNALGRAALRIGLNTSEIGPTLRSGLTKGMQSPRGVPNKPDIPAQRPPAGVDPTTGEVVEDVETPEQTAARHHASRVQSELDQLRARHEAKTTFDAERAARDFREPKYRATLTEELQQADDPITYAIEELLPSGGNALLAAQFKAGKTTLVTNLLKAYADDVPFLGRFKVNPGNGRIAIFNYELSDQQYRRWLREAGIVNTDRVAVLHLRGHRLPITSPTVEDWIVRWLQEQTVTFWIADPFARAATGTDENSNTEVGVWLDTLDVIKARAGVTDLVLPTHTGRAEHDQGSERARGATRLDDWADVRWLLMKDKEDNRFFRATGRDVELPEEALTFNEADRSLVLGGGDRRHVRQRGLEQKVLDWIAEHDGASLNAIKQGVGGSKDAVAAAVESLVHSGAVGRSTHGQTQRHTARRKGVLAS